MPNTAAFFNFNAVFRKNCFYQSNIQKHAIPSCLHHNHVPLTKSGAITLCLLHSHLLLAESGACSQKKNAVTDNPKLLMSRKQLRCLKHQNVYNLLTSSRGPQQLCTNSNEYTIKFSLYILVRQNAFEINSHSIHHKTFYYATFSCWLQQEQYYCYKVNNCSHCTACQLFQYCVLDHIVLRTYPVRKRFVNYLIMIPKYKLKSKTYTNLLGCNQHLIRAV